jgi:hypothetical protein
MTMAVFEVTKPAFRGAIHMSDDYLQTLPISALGPGSNRIFQLLQTLSARPSLPALEMVSKKVEAPRLGGIYDSGLFRMQGKTGSCRPVLHHL